MTTKSVKKSEIKRNWHLVDVKNQILGRVSTQIAELLIGKHKTYLVDYLDCGDYVVVINSDKVKVSGRKDQQKIYYRHSGYPSGLKEIPYEKQLANDSRQIIIRAVKNMLPKNKHRQLRLKRLKTFPGSEHIYQDKFTNNKK